MSSYDLLVIGGGINGLGIAADAAARGLRVLLAEKGDLSGGTTAASSRLIHGGLRYLQYGELSLVRESLRERGILARQRPHLVRPIQLLIPHYQGSRPPGWMIGIGLALYAGLAWDPAFPAPRRLTREEALEREPALAPDGLRGGFLYPDAQIAFPERLCVELRRECRAAGGEVRTYTRVTELRARNGQVSGAALRDELTGEEAEIQASVVVNAAGPWVDAVNALLPAPPPRLIGGTCGTHLVLPRRPLGNAGPIYATARQDGRPFFLLPWDGRVLVGTTDVKFDGDPDQARTERWEVDYLLAETNALLPGTGYTDADVQWTTIGVRPLPVSSRSAGAITRRHFLVDHGVRDGMRAFGSVVGGKLTTYRSLAESVADWVFRALGREPARCTTRDSRPAIAPDELTRRTAAELTALGVDGALAPRLVHLYGAEAEAVVARARRQPALAERLTPGAPALRAEVAHALDAEGARAAEDILLRRLMLLPPPAGAVEAVQREMQGPKAR